MNREALPLVSIVIPVFNQERFVREALESALNQDYPELEVIASDDRSTDTSRDVLNDLAAKHSRLQVILQDTNLGIVKHVTWLLKQGSGEYIVRLDSDDRLHPNYVSELVQMMQAAPSAGYAHGSVQEIDDRGNERTKRFLNRKTGFQSAEDSIYAMTSGYRVAANILMYRRAALQNTVFDDFGVDFAEDWYLAVQLANHGWGNVYSASVLSSYRVWSDDEQTRPRRKIAELNGILQVFEKGLRPAFMSRQWSTDILSRQLCLLAISHSLALESSLWSPAERMEMKRLLSRMSSSSAQSTCVWLVEHRLGFLIKSIFWCKKILKHSLQKLITR